MKTWIKNLIVILNLNACKRKVNKYVIVSKLLCVIFIKIHLIKVNKLIKDRIGGRVGGEELNELIKAQEIVSFLIMLSVRVSGKREEKDLKILKKGYFNVQKLSGKALLDYFKGESKLESFQDFWLLLKT